VTRTAEQWLLGFDDPFLKEVAPSSQIVGYNLQSNISTVEAETVPYVTYFTGGSATVDLLHDYSGYTQTHSWQTIQDIIYASDGTSVPPSFNNNTINVYLPSLDRVFVLAFNASSSVLGISTKRYTLNETQFLASSTPDITINGILPLYNLSGATHHTPMFASLPMFCFVNLSSFNPVSLTDLQTNCFQNYWTFVDVDPVTGLFFNAIQQLQVSTMLDTSKYTVFNSALMNVSNNLPYAAPMYTLTLSGSLTQSDANTYKSTITAASEASFVSLIVLVIVGGLLVITAIILLLIPVEDDGLYPVMSVDLEMSKT